MAFIHCFTSILFELFIFALNSRFRGFWKIPNTLISRIKEFNLERRMINLLGSRDRGEKFQKDKFELNKKMMEHHDVVIIALNTEANTEAGFQFFLQLLYLMPTIIIMVAKATNHVEGKDGKVGKLEDLFNVRVASILASFVTISRMYCVIRNNVKRDALGLISYISQTVKIILGKSQFDNNMTRPVLINFVIITFRVTDTASRISIVCIWMICVNNGSFDPLK